MFEADHMAMAAAMHGEGEDMEGDLITSMTSKSQQRTAVNKFQEEWYPEGIDPMRQTFLKRSLRNHAFNTGSSGQHAAH